MDPVRTDHQVPLKGSPTGGTNTEDPRLLRRSADMNDLLTAMDARLVWEVIVQDLYELLPIYDALTEAQPASIMLVCGCYQDEGSDCFWSMAGRSLEKAKPSGKQSWARSTGPETFSI